MAKEQERKVELKSNPVVVMYSILHPPQCQTEYLSGDSVHEAIEEEWGEYAALPDSTDSTLQMLLLWS